MNDFTANQFEAAQKFVAATIEAFQNERGVHAETAIAGTARMAGTFLFRSFGLPLADVVPGQAVMSDKADKHGPELIQIMVAVLGQLGVNIDHQRCSGTPSPDHQSSLSFLETQKQLEPPYTEIVQHLGLSLPEAAQSAAAACAVLIQQCSAILDPHSAFDIALYGFVEGSKTAPDPLVI